MAETQEVCPTLKPTDGAKPETGSTHFFFKKILRYDISISLTNPVPVKLYHTLDMQTTFSF